MALVALMVLAGSGSATTILPPFHGAVSFWVHPDSQGCGSYGFTHKWTFNFTSGKGGVVDWAHAHGCKNAIPGVNDFSEGCACAQNTLGIFVKVGHGAKSVAVNWSATINVSGSYKVSGSCPTTFHQYINPYNGSYDYNYTYGDCFAAASVFFGANAWMYDETNGSSIYYGGPIWVSASTFVGNETRIYWGCNGPAYGSPSCFNYNSTFSTPTTSFATTYSATGTAYLNGTYVGGHRYVFEMFFYGNPIAQAGGGYLVEGATASLNALTGGNGLSINYITVT